MFVKFKQKLKSLKKIYIVLGIMFFLLLIAVGGLFWYFNSTKNSLQDQLTGSRWDEDGDGYQFSVFYDSTAEIETGFLEDFEHKYVIDLKSTIGDSDSLADNLKEYFASAYMMEGRMSLNTENKIMKDVKTYGVSGDYFVFHPLKLIAGSYLNGIHEDSVLIDEDTAWTLFGSYDIIGMTVLVNDVPLFVEGIYEENDNAFEEVAKGYNSFANVSVDENGSQNEGAIRSLIYVPFNTLAKLGTSSQKISAYEFVTTAPSDYYVMQFMREQMKSQLNHMQIVSNTTRFEIDNLINVWKERKYRSMHSDTTFFPYYENVARAYEDILAKVMVAIFVCIVIDTIILFIFIHYFWVNRKLLRLPVLKDKIERRVDAIRTRSKDTKDKWKDF